MTEWTCEDDITVHHNHVCLEWRNLEVRRDHGTAVSGSGSTLWPWSGHLSQACVTRIQGSFRGTEILTGMVPLICALHD